MGVTVARTLMQCHDPVRIRTLAYACVYPYSIYLLVMQRLHGFAIRQRAALDYSPLYRPIHSLCCGMASISIVFVYLG